MILVLRGADFSTNKIGTKSINEVASLTINGASTFEGYQTTYTCIATYTDGTTGAVSPSWQTTSTMYASIGANGVLTVYSGANNYSVGILASYGGVTATKTVTVTYSFTAGVDVVIGSTDYNGALQSIQPNAGNLTSSQVSYTFIMPAASGKQLAMAYSEVTISGVSYSPTLRVVGLQSNAYGTTDSPNSARVRTDGNSPYGYNGAIHGGGTYTTPSGTIEIPLQYDETLTTKNENIPYVAINIIFKDTATNSTSLQLTEQNIAILNESTLTFTIS